MKLIYKILIAVGVLLAVYIGAFIHGRSSVEKYPTEYTRQLGIELDRSIKSSRLAAEYSQGIEEQNQRFRDAAYDLVDGVGDDVEKLEDGAEKSRAILNKCLEFVQELRKIDAETEEE